MKAKMEAPTKAPTATRAWAPTKRSVVVGMSRLAFDAVAGGDGPAGAPATLQNAVRCYLGDRGANRPAWPYPAFLRGSEVQEDVQLELSIKDDLWLSFEAEAARQDVSPQRLLEHAAFYFAAEMDAGRITQRILDDLEATEKG